MDFCAVVDGEGDVGGMIGHPFQIGQQIQKDNERLGKENPRRGTSLHSQ